MIFIHAFLECSFFVSIVSGFFVYFSVLVAAAAVGAAAVAGFFFHIIANSNWIIILNCYAGSAIESRWYVTSHRKLHTHTEKNDGTHEELRKQRQ